MMGNKSIEVMGATGAVGGNTLAQLTRMQKIDHISSLGQKPDSNLTWNDFQSITK